MVAARVLWRRSTPAPAPHQQLGADLVKACTPDNFCKKLEVISRHQTAKWFEAKNLGTRFRTADREEKGVGTGNTWWALFASEEIGEGLATWRRAAAVPHPVAAFREGERERARRLRREERRRLAVRVTSQYIYGPGCSWAFNRPSPFSFQAEMRM